MYNSKSCLDLKVIWKDDEMFELEIKASNGRYTGTTNVYDTKESLSSFAELLKGYPKDNSTLFTKPVKRTTKTVMHIFQ